jgi:hypothetical protein
MSFGLKRGTSSRPARAATPRTYLFVPADEPLAAAQAVWTARTAIDLCVAGPSQAARDAAAFAVAGRAVRTVCEPLLGAPPFGESPTEAAAREADALLALYALDTRSALVVWDALPSAPPPATSYDETWLLETAERIGRSLPLP